MTTRTKRSRSGSRASEESKVNLKPAATTFDWRRVADRKFVKAAWGHRIKNRWKTLVLAALVTSAERDVALTGRIASMLASSPSEPGDHLRQIKSIVPRRQDEELRDLNLTLLRLGEVFTPKDSSLVILSETEHQELCESLDLLAIYWRYEVCRPILTPGVEKICSLALKAESLNLLMQRIPDRFCHALFQWSWGNKVVLSQDTNIRSLEHRSTMFVNMCNFTTNLSDFQRDLILPALSACSGLCVVEVSNKSAELCFSQAKKSIDTFISLAGHNDGHIRALALRMIGYFSSGRNVEAVDYTLVRGAAKAVCAALSDGRTNTAPARKDCWWTIYNWSSGSDFQRSFVLSGDEASSRSISQEERNPQASERLDFHLLALKCFHQEVDFKVSKEIAIFLEKAMHDGDFPDDLLLSAVDFVIGRFNTDDSLMEKTVKEMVFQGSYEKAEEIEHSWIIWLIASMLRRCCSYASASDKNLAALRRYKDPIQRIVAQLNRYKSCSALFQTLVYLNVLELHAELAQLLESTTTDDMA